MQALLQRSLRFHEIDVLRSIPRIFIRWGPPSWKAALQKLVLVGTKLNMSPQCALAAKHPGLHETKHGQYGDPSPLFHLLLYSTWSSVPVLGSPVQERYGHTEESTVKGHEED